jgi:membrane peptidoglycan carboxypeptidase
LWRARKVLFVMAFLLFTALAGTAYALSRVSLPPPFHQEQTTTLLDANGKPIAYLSGTTNRQPITINQVPQVVIDAVVATEDHNFFHHHGVDPLGIARAAINDLLGRGNLQGASTLTQQYVKNAYLGQQRTLGRKVKEAVLSLKLERQLSKQQILERYLNTIYFGRGAYGIEAAAGAYFNKDVQQLTLPEAAFLAGAIRAPEYADPVRDPVTAKARRDASLRDMAKYHKITEAQARDATASPLEAHPYTPNNQQIADDAKNIGVEYYVADVTRVLIQSLPGGESTVYGGGLTVRTSLDLNFQRMAYDAVYQTLTSTSGPAGALVSVDNSGAIKAMVGGRSYADSQVNLALGAAGGGTGRQAGSTFKTVLLAQIVKDGFSVLTQYRAPAQITLPKANNGKDWTVNNFSDEDYSGSSGEGTLSLVDAIKNSVNTVFAQAVMAEGPGRLAQMGDNLGLGPNLPHYASLVLGSVDESVAQMAGAYSTFMDYGTFVNPHTVITVKNSAGQEITPQQQAPRQVLTRQQSDIVTYCLQQVVLGGTGTLARFGHESAGKTGTTENNTDAWFVGYTPQQLTTAVWVGYPTGSRPMTGIYGLKQVTGGTIPADIWRRFMSSALSGAPFTKFDPAPSLDGTRGALGQVPATYPTTTTTSTSTTSTTSTTLAPTTTTSTQPPPPNTTTTTGK